MSHYSDTLEAIELENMANELARAKGLNVPDSGYKTKPQRIAIIKNKIEDLIANSIKIETEIQRLRDELKIFFLRILCKADESNRLF